MDWIITVDALVEPGGPIAVSNVGRMSCDPDLARAVRVTPKEHRAALLAPFKAGMTHEFRLFDDDGVLYYEGLCKDLDRQDGDSAFGPLDWAEADSGCTRMDVRKIGEAKWEVL